jgi:PAS domain S-box-containing protein
MMDKGRKDMTISRDRILLVEDHKTGKSLMNVTGYKDFGYDYKIAGSVSEARTMLDSDKFDIVIADYLLGDGTALDILNFTNDIPVIVISEDSDFEVAVNAMKAGAYDYLFKDVAGNYFKVLQVTVEKAINRKVTEKRLRLLESAIANANDAIIILEAEPGESRGRRILYVNEAFTRMTGYTFEDASGRTLRMLRGPNTSLAEVTKIREAFDRRKPVRVELVNYRKDGSEFWVECNIVPFADEKGLFLHWVSVQRDITERKQAEKEKERLMYKINAINADLTDLNQQLETIGTERTMSLIALTVADRVRNPAAMIGARCRKILAKQDIPEDLRESFKYIAEGAERLDAIVKEFETLLKNRQSQFAHYDLNKVVESVVSIVKKEASNKGVEMIVNIFKGDLKINMQKDLLRVAVYHIMRNAIDATPGGGRIMVGTYGDENNAFLSVSDTGQGISKESLENIFKPFFTTKEKGFGLGLSLVKQIVSEHLGKVSLESKVGEGSTFKMSFPFRWKEEKLS